MRTVHSDRKTFRCERMLAFSDGIMAVAATLLVLNLQLPEGVTDAQLGSVLSQNLHALGVYVLSFIVVGLLWIGHHEQFSHLSRIDGVLIWLNLLYLMTIGLIPFLTSLLSDHSTALSTVLYATTLVITSLLSAAMWWYASRDPLLMAEDVPEGVRREGLLNSLLTGGVFALSIPIAVFWSATAAQLSWLLLIATGRVATLADK